LSKDILSKEEIITFKVNKELGEFLKNLPNKSEFIRNAILKSMDNVCPLCNGLGFLTDSQIKHWKEFSKNHKFIKCSKCNQEYLSCDNKEE